MLTLLTVIDLAWPSRAKLVPSIAELRKSQGGISNIFLCRLAENIQDKYGEAAIFAEQEPALLSLSIQENIAYGRSATTYQIEDAADIAHAHTFISSLGKGYETQVGCAGLGFRRNTRYPHHQFLDEVTDGTPPRRSPPPCAQVVTFLHLLVADQCLPSTPPPSQLSCRRCVQRNKGVAVEEEKNLVKVGKNGAEEETEVGRIWQRRRTRIQWNRPAFCTDYLWSCRSCTGVVVSKCMNWVMILQATPAVMRAIAI
ncbi:hypothetical protein QYE76_071273 [Lolium multiflorum]|uniref:Uncharacterized protein n=1 Tax=Lolium multiflorum TaxID=4521 RepID=A0AAD8SL22_LOLMU|nr:hypothetical protein QYE76_071273 [Lolium multiflorum]